MTFPENEILEILFRKESLIETKSLGLFPQRANSIRQPGAMVMFTREDKMKYRSGTLNSNTVNSKFHLIRSFFEIFARFLSFHV